MGCDRITIPVDIDRTPGATLAVAAAVSRQSDLGLEFVAVATPGVPDPTHRLRARCAAAGASGVASPSWALLEGVDADVGAYATWSGTRMMCVGTRAHQPRSVVGEPWPAALRTCGVPMLVVGRHLDRPASHIRRVVAGLDSSTSAAHVAGAAATLAWRLDVDLVLTEVVAPHGWRADVNESAFLHGVAATLEHRPCSFDTLHDDRPAAGLLRFVGADATTVLVVGMPAHRHVRGVAHSVVRHAACPVLLVPAAPC